LTDSLYVSIASTRTSTSYGCACVVLMPFI